ncbi:MAG TPA: hypothetical protein VN519_16015 [Bryobacteraceae bacterium]|nr:hypothetical protein [Bryobacteraceae bacterium]
MEKGVCVRLIVLACGGIVLSGAIFAQTAPAADPNAGALTAPPGSVDPRPDPNALPLTPTEEREKLVREYDPLAQETSKGQAKGKAGQTPPGETPIPGSIADSDQRSAEARRGPQVTEDDAEAGPVQEYNGPAVLSRSYTINRPLVPEQVKWSESLGVSSIYDSGVTGHLINPDGSPASGSSTLIGTMVNWSFGGRHYFRHDQIAVNYTGNMQRYSGANAYDGANHLLNLSYSHVLTRRLSLNFVEAGAYYSQNYTLQNQTVGPESIANINLASSPNLQLYDTATKQFSSQVDLTWQKSSRLSMSIGGSWFGIARNSPQLLGTTGEQAQSDINYRFTRKTTVGAYYSFSHYRYSHGFGTSDTNGIGLIYSYALTRTMQIRFRGGVSRVESLGLQTVRINPLIAAILGETFGIVDVSQRIRTADYSAQFVKDFGGHASFSLAYARGISPGNGVFQTSQQVSSSGTFTTRVFRVYTLSLGAGRDSLASIAQALGNYQSDYGRIGLSRTYKRGVGLNFTIDYRHFDVTSFAALRNQIRITSGVTWSPGTGRLWPF